MLISTRPAVFLMLSYRRDALTAALYDAQTWDWHTPQWKKNHASNEQQTSVVFFCHVECVCWIRLVWITEAPPWQREVLKWHETQTNRRIRLPPPPPRRLAARSVTHRRDRENHSAKTVSHVCHCASGVAKKKKREDPKFVPSHAQPKCYRASPTVAMAAG